MLREIELFSWQYTQAVVIFEIIFRAFGGANEGGKVKTKGRTNIGPALVYLGFSGNARIISFF